MTVSFTRRVKPGCNFRPMRASLALHTDVGPLQTFDRHGAAKMPPLAPSARG
jgi:hypothetical protein